MSRVWGRHAPTRSLRKCRRIVEVKSQMDRKFSRIENLWPRDGSCPPPLRSKSTFNKCFRIVKTQKISRGDSARVMRLPFAPNEVPAPVCAAALTRSRYHVRSAHEIFKVRFPQKEKTAHAAQRWILSGWTGGKMNRVCCGAVDSFWDFSSPKCWVSRW